MHHEKRLRQKILSTTERREYGFAEKLNSNLTSTVDLALLGGKVEANHLLNLNVGKILTLGYFRQDPGST